MQNAEHPVQAYLGRFSDGSRPAIRHALRVIAVLMGVADGDPLKVDWDSLTLERCQELRNTLLARYARATSNRILMALRGVCRVAAAQGRIAPSVADAIRGAGTTRVQRPGVATEELEALFDSCHRDGTPSGCRDAAALALIYAVGLKRAEAVALDREDFLSSGELMVKRGPRRRSVKHPLARCVRAALDAWIELRGEVPGPLLCPINKAGKIQIRRMTAQALYLIVKRRAQDAGVRISPDNLTKMYAGKRRAMARLATRPLPDAAHSVDHVVMLHVPFRGCGPRRDVVHPGPCTEVM